MQTDKKSAILQFIQDHPGVKSIEIEVGLSRASIGAHTKVLLDRGLLIRDNTDGWHIAANYVATTAPKVITPIDIAAEFIRKMIDLK
jgi:predicted DNA-binding transcriptional regulator